MSKKDDEILSEAKERFTHANEWESEARNHFIADYKFGNGDANNGFQWPNTLLKARNLDDRPALTINKTRQHCLQILNDMRQNKMQVRVIPVGDGATYEAAQLFEDVVRHIEYRSHAQAAYDHAAVFQVYSGIGYWRITTDYVSSDSLDQEIRILRISDPLMVLLDPDIQEADGADARFAFVFQDIPTDKFERQYPKYKDKATSNPLGIMGSDWHTKDTVRVAEYFTRSEKRDVLYRLPDGKTVRKSEIGPEIAGALDDDETVDKRNVTDNSIDWYLIIGDEIAEKRKWAGSYIPIVRVIGEETVIDGVLDRKGHVRALKDPQRMYNYWSSAAVEFVALQSKVPYVIPIESVEGVEQYWETANRVNHSYLPYKAIGEAGQPLPPPQRSEPPQVPQAFLSGMAAAANEMMMVSGQYQSQMGEQSNERTGIAIQERQRQGDNATYHYIDNLARAIRFTGRILMDLIPKIYDTPRILMIAQENGSVSQVQIDPEAKTAAQVPPQTPEQQQKDALQQQAAMAILNPKIGAYMVESDVGPAYATKRQDAFHALMELAKMSPVVMQAAPDLVMKAADFPMADELAERLRNMVPPQAFGAADPATQAAQEQITHLQGVIATLTESLAEAKALTRERSQQKDIDVYKAETDRLKVVGANAPEALIPIIRQLMAETLNTHLSPILAASSGSLQGAIQPPASAGLTNGVPNV